MEKILGFQAFLASRFGCRFNLENTFLLALVYLAIKFTFSYFIPLIGDEAYYWVWAQNLQLSYFDHPPFVAWLFRLSQFDFGILGPRWISLVMSAATILVWIKISDPYFVNKKSLRFWILILMLSPTIGFGSLIVTPDVPLMFFWSLSTWLAIKILNKQKAFDYALLGVCLGLGFCSKYHIVLWVIGFCVFFIVEKKWSLVSWKKLILTFIFGFVFSLPVILWNIRNDFASFRFQIDHGFNQGSLNPRWIAEYFLGQMLILFPLFLSKKFYVNPKSESLKIHFYLGWTPLVFFLFSSFKAPVEINWPLMSMAHLGLIFVLQLSNLHWQKFYISFWSSVAALVIFCTLYPQYNFIHGKLNEPKKYSSGLFKNQAYRPLYTSTYQMAASIWYFSKIPTYKLRGQSRYDFFDTLDGSNVTASEFYYLKEDYQDMPEDLGKRGYVFEKLIQPYVGHSLYKVVKK